MGPFKTAAIAILAVFAPIQAVIVSVGVLVAADMITGIWAAHKQSKSITSAGLRRTVSKLIIYQVAILSGFLVEHYLAGDIVPIVKLIGGVIGMVELKSILENVNVINGVDIFKSVLQKLGSQNDKPNGN